MESRIAISTVAHLGKGQTMTEYSLILGAVAVVVFVSYEAMGDHIIAKILRVAILSKTRPSVAVLVQSWAQYSPTHLKGHSRSEAS